MTPALKTISFPLILIATIAGAVFAGIAIIFMTFINMLKAIYQVIYEMYNE